MNMALEIKHEAVWHDEVIVDTHLLTDPDYVVPIKIEQNVTGRLVPKVEKEVSPCKDTGVGTAPVNTRFGVTEEDIRTEVVPCKEEDDDDDEDEEKDIQPYEIYASLQMDIGVETAPVNMFGITEEDVRTEVVPCKEEDDDDDDDDNEEKEMQPYEFYAALQMDMNHSNDQDTDAASSKWFPPLSSAVNGASVVTKFQNYSRKYSKSLGGPVDTSSHQENDLLLQKDDEVLPEIHVKSRRWVCPLCDKVFTRRKKMQDHMETHSKWMGHACKYCEKAFSQKSSLESHLVSHLRPMPVSCKVCFKVCKTDNGLKRHMFTHGEKLSYSCDFCFRLFSSRLDLEFHLKSHVEVERKSSRLKSKTKI